MKQLFTALLLLASLFCNAQNFGFNKEDSSIYTHQINKDTAFKIEPWIDSIPFTQNSFSIRIDTDFSVITFMTNEKGDSVTEVYIIGDTLKAFQGLYKVLTSQIEELRLATSILDMIDLDSLYALSSSRELFNRTKKYRDFIKKKK